MSRQQLEREFRQVAGEAGIDAVLDLFLDDLTAGKIERLLPALYRRAPSLRLIRSAAFALERMGIDPSEAQNIVQTVAERHGRPASEAAVLGPFLRLCLTEAQGRKRQARHNPDKPSVKTGKEHAHA